MRFRNFCGSYACSRGSIDYILFHYQNAVHCQPKISINSLKQLRRVNANLHEQGLIWIQILRTCSQMRYFILAITDDKI